MLKKLAQANPEDTSDEAVKAPLAFSIPKAKRELIAYPDYSRSLVSQRWQDPASTGGKFAIGGGALGAALGMLLARLAKNDPKLVAAGGLVGGVGGALLGNEAGKASANSENSRTFWLRRKPGINDPGEYESALRYAGRPMESIKPREKKAGIAREAVKALIKRYGASGVRKGTNVAKDVAAGAAGLGAGEALVRVGDYQDVPTASLLTRTSMPAVAIALRRNPALAKYLVGAAYAEQLGAGGLVAAKRSAEASKATADSMRAQATAITGQSQALKDQVSATKDVAKGNLGQVLKDTLSSPAALGSYAGLGVAGLGGLATGLTRAKTDEELQRGTSRGKMVAKDFLRYAIPLGLAGGVVGSMQGPAKA